MLLTKLNTLRNSREEEGFTLIELMIVVVIIGILAAIALPIFSNQQKAANAGTIKSDVRNTAGNVALALAKTPMASGFKGHATDEAAPTLGAGEAAVKVVKSQGNTILISDIAPEGWDGNVSSLTGDGTWSGYQVTGYNSDFCWTFNSTTGKSDECVPTPSTGSTGGTGGGATAGTATSNPSLATYSAGPVLNNTIQATSMSVLPSNKLAMGTGHNSTVAIYDPATQTGQVIATADENGKAFTRITGTTVDAAGNIYAIDGLANKIYKITETGTVTTLLTNVIEAPNGNSNDFLSLDAAGNFYTNYMSAIWKISPSGTATKVTAAPVYISGLEVKPNGEVYFIGTDSTNSLYGVFKVNANGTSTRFVDTNAIAGASNRAWNDLVFDSSGNLYAPSYGHNKLFKVTPDGTVSVVGTSTQPSVLALGADGKMYAKNYSTHRIQVFS